MARYGSDDVAFLLVDGYSLLGYSTELDFKREALTAETTVLGVADETHAALGRNRADLTQAGFYDDAADASNAALVGLAGTARVVSFGFEGNTVGKKFTGGQGLQAEYDRVVDLGDFHKANAAYKMTGAVDEGVILHELSAETATSGDTEGAESVHDVAAQTTAGGVAYLQVPALTLGGWTSVTIKVRDSADDITYADLVTFANVTAAPAKERQTVAGNIDQYLAHSWVFNGAGAAKSITYMVGFARN